MPARPRQSQSVEVDLAALFPVGSHTVDSTLSAAQTMAPPEGADRVLIQALTQNVRYTLDGTAPTASTGFQLKAGDPPVLILTPTGITLTLIEEAASATIQYQWGK